LIRIRSRVLAPGDFFSRLRKGLKSKLPPELRHYEFGRGRGRLVKVHFGHSETHFEVWHHTGAGRLEVGLHFEGDASLNQRAFDFFRARMVEVKGELPHAELEPWDRGWSRLYETIVAPNLDERALAEGTDLLVSYIKTLQPIVESFWEE
jgi:hypothetical protein